MCMGRPAHHIEEEKRRYAAAQAAIEREARRQMQAQEARMRQEFEAANARQQEMLKTIQESSRQPYRVKTNEDATNPTLALRNKAKKRGVNSLRISRDATVNVGGNPGTNLG